MGISNEELMHLIREDLEKYNGVRRPLKASKAEQLLVKAVSPRELHPNPDDEFCKKDVGPSFRIIDEYAENFRRSTLIGTDVVGEALVVEKMYPDGYLILNGHHRWAAALRSDLKKVPIKIVNLTHEEDIRRMLENARSNVRVVFDLDEVIFCRSEVEAAEAELPQPFNRIFKERIRKGFPALAAALSEEGFDLWVYTRGLYSVDYLEMMFAEYHIHVDGIVSEARTAKKFAASMNGEAADSIKEKKPVTILHIDRDSVLCTNSQAKAFEHVTFEASDEDWGCETLRVVRELTSAAQ